MPDLKISQLPVASATTGAELFPVVQGGVTKQIALNNVQQVGTLTSLAVSGDVTVATSSGNLNVGAAVTSTTWGKFVGVQAAYPGVVLDSTAPSGRKFSLGVDATQWYLRDETASATRLLVDSSGNLGIGTTSPAALAEFSKATTDATVLQEVVRLSTTGRSAGGGTANRGTLLSISDSANQTLVGAVGGLRENSAANWGGALAFYTNGTASPSTGVSTLTERARIDASGNLGLGVTPSAWATGCTAFQLDSYSALFESVVGKTSLAFNARESASNSYVYLQNEAATMYQQVSGVHSWHTAASGTAGNAISFVQDMTLTGGQLALGTATASTTLGRNITVNGASAGTNTGIILSSASVERGYIYGNDTQVAVGSITSIPTVFTTNNTERARITAGGNVLVGATSDYRSGRLVVKAASVTQASTTANFHISTTDAQAIDLGGSMGLGGLVGGDEVPFGVISGRKENGSSGNYAGYLAFATTTSGAATVERARVKSTGQVRFVPLDADPAGAETGDVYYNSSTNKLRVYNGAWVDLH
jgi:hypothetical protein